MTRRGDLYLQSLLALTSINNKLIAATYSSGDICGQGELRIANFRVDSRYKVIYIKALICLRLDLDNSKKCIVLYLAHFIKTFAFSLCCFMLNGTYCLSVALRTKLYLQKLFVKVVSKKFAKSIVMQLNLAQEDKILLWVSSQAGQANLKRRE